jgi:pyruvate dehydrogenase E2 component (dihydrolipoamide acetyltransferase)
MNETTHRNLPVQEIIPLGLIRKSMVKAMKDSVQRAALSQITREVDLSSVIALRKRYDGKAPSLNIYIMVAVAQTLKRHPLLNAELDGDQVLVFDRVNLGMAIAIPDGLIVAVIPEADKKSLAEMDAAVEDLVMRARSGKLGFKDIEGGTFTVSNLGMYDVDGGFPLPRPPEGAILLVGRSKPRPVVTNGELAIGELAWFSLTYDHRFIDGALAANFLLDLQNLLLIDYIS